MRKILIVDDINENIMALEFAIEDYMDDKEIEDYQIDTAIDPLKGLSMSRENLYDIIFLDVMMPHLDGFGFLQLLRNDQNLKKQPIIIMATALGDADTIKKEKKYGANAYMVKPIRFKVVQVVLDKYFVTLDEGDFDVEDEFDFNFDFDDSDNSEDEFLENEKDLLFTQIIRKGYTPLAAEEFMDAYEYNADVIEDKLYDLDKFIFEVFDDGIEDTIDLEIEIDNIKKIFYQLNELLSKFAELTDLYMCISSLSEKLDNIDFTTLSTQKKETIGKFVKSIVFDIIEFKTQVFIEKKTDNIYYANASIASSCLQINNFL